jgi:hypothetical protein
MPHTNPEPWAVKDASRSISPFFFSSFAACADGAAEERIAFHPHIIFSSSFAACADGAATAVPEPWAATNISRSNSPLFIQHPEHAVCSGHRP